ncbi:hypothetical protein FRX31_019257, partial [Thalictrum thalictroides]
MAMNASAETVVDTTIAEQEGVIENGEVKQHQQQPTHQAETEKAQTVETNNEDTTTLRVEVQTKNNFEVLNEVEVEFVPETQDTSSSTSNQ